MSVPLPIQTIGKACGPNPGFVRKLWLVDSRQVQHAPDPLYLAGNDSLLVPSRMISFFSEAKFFNMAFRNKECFFNEALVRGESGTKFTQAIQFTFPRTSIFTNAWMVDNINTRWIVFFEDHLHEVRILGTPSLPADLVISSVLNADKTTSAQLSCESLHSAYYTDSMPDLERIFGSGFGESFG